MKYNGVLIKGIKIVNESNNNEVVATIIEGHIESINGYKVEIMPINVECHE